jgi:hypothetical protein
MVSGMTSTRYEFYDWPEERKPRCRRARILPAEPSQYTVPRRRSVAETAIVLAALIVAIGIFPVVPFLVIVIAFYQLATGQ